MGIAFDYIDAMDQRGLFTRGGSRISILDIGTSNLYSAAVDRVRQFVLKHNPGDVDDLDEFSRRVAAGSLYDPSGAGVRNQSWAGELFERAGMDYVSFDIAQGYKTTLLDLNRALLPSEFRGRFDLVLNFGTTEHVFNQLNAEASKVGGFIYHQLPATGYTDHCYFTYTGRFFFDLASFNAYEVFDFWLDGPAGFDSIWQAVRSHMNRHPTVERALSSVKAQKLAAMDIPNIAINVIYRKVRDTPFVAALDTSTSVGTVSTQLFLADDRHRESTNAPVEVNMNTAMQVSLEAAVATCLADVRRLRSEMDQLRRYLAILRPLKPVLDRFLRR
jgi:hypothetical protein